jgi:hypothetical protein
MKKILIIGNSHVGELYDFYKTLSKSDHEYEWYFYCIPGGGGPSLRVEGGCIVDVGTEDRKFPPYQSPNFSSLNKIDFYDAIVISSLGAFDGTPFAQPFYGLTQGVIYDFEPKVNNISNRPITKDAARTILFNIYATLHQFIFLQSLRKSYQGNIYAFPKPLIGKSALHNPDWIFNIMYNHPVAAYDFFRLKRDEYLRNICLANSVTLFDNPFASEGFTPDYLLTDNLIHGNSLYGAILWDLMVKKIKFL